MVAALRDAVRCRARGSPALQLDLAPLSLRMQGRAAEAWLCSWLLAWLRWADAVADGPVHVKLSTSGDTPRARLSLEFVPQRGASPALGSAQDPWPAAPCWQSFLPIGAALHEIRRAPARHGEAGPGSGSGSGSDGRPAPARHRVHLDLGPCRIEG